jgi:integrase/recombinase XerD
VPRASSVGQAELRAPHDPQGLAAYVLRYLEWLQIHNYAAPTVQNRQSYLGVFVAWCADRGLATPKEITKPILERYQRSLYTHRKANGEPLTFRAQHARLIPVEQVLAQPDTSESMGIRDRAILEVFYSTGMRRSELMGLGLFDLDRERGTVMIRQGKGKKDRMIPIGERALRWIDRYQTQVRPELVIAKGNATLFLTQAGESFTPDRLTQLVRGYVNAADIGKTGSCHLLRHTMATLMLENGADIRYIQAMLGHAELSTTQIYTQVSIRKLKEIHSATHPAKVRSARVPADSSIGDESPTPAPTVNDILAALAAEADEEHEDDNDVDAEGGLDAGAGIST